jgi:hypothetical protein
MVSVPILHGLTGGVAAHAWLEKTKLPGGGEVYYTGKDAKAFAPWHGHPR